MTKLNYGYTPQNQKSSETSSNPVSSAKTAMSKQAIANQVVLNSMPQQPAQGAGFPAQSTGFGRTI